MKTFTLDELTIDDERSFRHIALYEGLKNALIRDKVRFSVLGEKATQRSWGRALFLNLTFWSPEEPGDVLVSRRIPADVVMHAAWHHVAGRALRDPSGAEAKNSAESLFLGESIASAFDVYLVGRLIGHAPNSEFLRTQVPAMSEVAKASGLPSRDFAKLLQSIADDPDGAFEALRSLLFDATRALFACGSVKEAARTIESFHHHRFAPLLHHYEISNWILYARAYAAPPATGRGANRDRMAAPSLAVNEALRHVPVALDWLEEHWLGEPGGGGGRGGQKKSAFSPALQIKKANLARRTKRS